MPGPSKAENINAANLASAARPGPNLFDRNAEPPDREQGRGQDGQRDPEPHCCGGAAIAPADRDAGRAPRPYRQRKSCVVGSSGGLDGCQAVADPFGQQIDDCNRYDDHRAEWLLTSVLVELADRDKEILADAAGADKADDRARPHVDLEAEQGVAGGGLGRICGRAAKRTASTKCPPALRTALSTDFMSISRPPR